MRVESTGKLPKYQVIGRKLRIHWDEQETSRDVEGEVQKGWSYEEACVPVQASRSAIIEAIIATKYPTPGAEFAALQNGPESVAEHQAMRVLAKELVAGWLAATPSESSGIPWAKAEKDADVEETEVEVDSALASLFGQ